MHLVGTIWFMLGVAYVLITVLRQAGIRWWILFSLSGHGALIVFVLISLYLFAVFRGLSSSQMLQIEHPITSTDYYTVFYVTTPFLGSLAGCLGMIGVPDTSRFVLGVVMGTLGATFLVWVIVDPAIGVFEVLLYPTGRRHRAQRLAQARANREAAQKNRQRLLADILEKEEARKQQWAELLQPEAKKLADLLMTAEAVDFDRAQRQATDIGANAWRIGGLGCMKQLRKMAIEACDRKNRKDALTDFISVWWDGIGNWQNPPINRTAGS